MRVVADQIAHSVAQEGTCHANLSVGGSFWRTPAVGPPPLGRADIASRQSFERMPGEDTAGRSAHTTDAIAWSNQFADITGPRARSQQD